MSKPYFQQYANLDSHWYRCRCCGGISWDSDTAAIAGKVDLSEADVRHDEVCPGVSFPVKYVNRITRTY